MAKRIRPSDDHATATFRPDIEGLRGVAVALVVLFHAGLLGIPGGFIGVDVFFVISGFLITGLLVREYERDGRISLVAFYARRIRRLAPAAFVVLALTAVAVVLLANPLDRSGLLLDGAASALSVGNLRFAAAAGDYFAAVSSPSPFLHFWSLAVEEQFYLLWPALLVGIIASAGRRRPRPVLTVGLLGVVTVSFVANIYLTHAAANWAFYALPTRAWELAVGGLVALGLHRQTDWPAPRPAVVEGLRMAAGAMGAVAIISAALFLNDAVPYPGVAALLPVLGTAALLCAGGRGVGRLLVVSPLRQLGRVSYSLYLWHWPLLIVPTMLRGAGLTTGEALAMVAVALICAYGSWRFIEQPFRQAATSRHQSRPSPHHGRVLVAGLGVLSTLAIVTSVIAYQPAASGPMAGLSRPSSVPLAPAGPWPVLTPPSALVSASRSPGASSAPVVTSVPSLVPAPSPTPVAVPVAPLGDRLPAGLYPAPAGSRADTTEARLRADGCMALDPDTTPGNCVYGDPRGTFSVALVGDSHATSWFTALDHIATVRGWRLVVFAKVRCPFMDMALYNVAEKRTYDECLTWNRTVVARLQALKPDLTLISFARAFVAPVDQRLATVPDEAASAARLIGAIPGRLGLIVDIPTSSQDEPACLAANPTSIHVCDFARDAAYGDSIGLREQAIAAISGAGLIDMADQICPGPICSPILDNILIFRDGSHLSATYSLHLSPILAARIDAIMVVPVRP